MCASADNHCGCRTLPDKPPSTPATAQVRSVARQDTDAGGAGVRQSRQTEETAFRDAETRSSPYPALLESKPVGSVVGLIDRGSADSACRDPSKQHTA